MRSISFAWTTPAYVAKVKLCTRREWEANYARSWKSGEVFYGLDRDRRYFGKEIGVSRMDGAPEYTNALPPEDYKLEGFEYLDMLGAKVNKHTPREHWDLWAAEMAADPEIRFWVIRYTYEHLTPYGEELFAADQEKLRRLLEPGPQARLL